MIKKVLSVLLILALTMSLAACSGSKNAGTNSESGFKPEAPTESLNEEIVFDEPYVLADNDKVTIKITRFFKIVGNAGSDSEFIDSGFEMEVENKMDEYYAGFSVSDFYMPDRRVFQLIPLNSNPIPPRMNGRYQFTRLNQDNDTEPFESLESIYDLKGILNLEVTDDKYHYSKLDEQYPFDFSVLRNR